MIYLNFTVETDEFQEEFYYFTSVYIYIYIEEKLEKFGYVIRFLIGALDKCFKKEWDWNSFQSWGYNLHWIWKTTLEVSHDIMKKKRILMIYETCETRSLFAVYWLWCSTLRAFDFMQNNRPSVSYTKQILKNKEKKNILPDT